MRAIEFTAETSLTNANFLDMTVTINEKYEPITSLYTHSTDCHNYLLCSSEYQRHLLQGIPYSQFLRVCRICTSVISFRQYALVLASHFLRPGHPKYLDNTDRAELQNRGNLLIKQCNKSPKQNDDLFYLVVVMHNKNYPPIKRHNL